jgi:hypothetical protein
MKKILTALLFAGLAMAFLGTGVSVAGECEGNVAKELGRYYQEMAYYLDTVLEPLTFNDKKTDVWDPFKKYYQQAIKIGMPDSCTMIVEDYRKRDGVKAITFSELKALYPKWAEVMEAKDGEDRISAMRKNRDNAGDEKAFGEFYKLLKGDKLAEFKKCKNCGWYTTGRRQMSKAQEFQNASLWCTEGSNWDGLGKWTVECHRFNGNKQINTWSKSGTGSATAPAWVFK